MQVQLDGPAGKLEGLLEEPEEGEVLGAAIVCHPHPLHEGTMRNTIVFRAARALRGAGFATLRFNFRGVEGSEGVHHGEGGAGSEEDDAACGLDFLAERYPDSPLWAAGFSFGSRTVCGLATRDERIERLVLVAFPVSIYACDCIHDIQQPALIVFGGNDEFGTAADLARKHPDLPERIEVEEIAGADHLFRGRTPLVEAAIQHYALAHVRRTS